MPGIGDCQPTLLRWGLPLELPEGRCSECVGGSKTGGGPYIAGCEVNEGRCWFEAKGGPA